ncbi:unnamed protein product, partial [Rotaria socialis]
MVMVKSIGYGDVDSCIISIIITNSHLSSQRLQFSRETELIEHVLQDIEHRVSTSGKAEVIGKQQDLLNSIQMIYRKPMTSFVTTPVPCDFP